MDEIRKMMDEEIKSQIEQLSELNPGTEEHAAATESLAKLYKLRVEEDKNELEYETKHDQMQADSNRQTFDEEMQNKQLHEQDKDRLIRIGLETAGIILPLVFYGIWMRRGFKFEETGAFTSTTFRGLIGRFRPTKK